MAGIQISNDPSGRIIVSFPYDPLLVEKVNPVVALEGQLGAPPTLYPAVHNCWIYQAVFYNALCNGWVKTIEGRRWHPIEKHWSFPNLAGILEKILKVFEDENVQIDPPRPSVKFFHPIQDACKSLRGEFDAISNYTSISRS